MSFDATAAGLWLIGVGSLLAVIPRLLRPERPELGLRWESLAERVPRLHFAAESVGLVLVAMGSVLVALGELGPLWFDAAGVVIAVLGVWFVAALKLRQLWRMRAETEMRGARFGRVQSRGDGERRVVGLFSAGVRCHGRLAA